MASRGELLDLLEAREVANNDLKRQDNVILVAQEHMTRLVEEREMLWGTWRLVNNELALAAAEVFPVEDHGGPLEPMEGNSPGAVG